MTQEKTQRNQEIAQRVRDGEVYRTIAEDYNISWQRVQEIARQEGVPPRGRRRGDEHHRWGGGRWIGNKGYVWLTIRNQDRVMEHRFVAEKNLGRPLETDEVVHHINGDKTDNRWENLQVMDVGEHTKLHQSSDCPAS